MLPWERTISLINPALSKRSRWSSGIVRCIGRLPTSFNEANSSAVSRGLFLDTESEVYFKRGIGFALC